MKQTSLEIRTTNRSVSSLQGTEYMDLSILLFIIYGNAVTEIET